jgi:hypothetical protein
MPHPIDCSSCPHCNPEMAAIMRDQIAGRWTSLASRMDTITNRTLRALGAKVTHPGYRALRVRALKSPTTEEFVSAFDTFKAERRRRSTPVIGRLAALLSATVTAPSGARTVPMVGTVPPAPDLTAAIRAARKE